MSYCDCCDSEVAHVKCFDCCDEDLQKAKRQGLVNASHLQALSYRKGAIDFVKEFVKSQTLYKNTPEDIEKMLENKVKVLEKGDL